MSQYQEQIRNLYLGILNNYPDFAEGEDVRLTYSSSYDRAVIE